MHFNVLAILSLAGIISGSVIPETDIELNPAPSLETSPVTILETGPSHLNKRETYSCAGTSLCSVDSGRLRSWCDMAVNSRLIRNDVVNYGGPGYTLIKFLLFGYTLFTNIVF